MSQLNSQLDLRRKCRHISKWISAKISFFEIYSVQGFSMIVLVNNKQLLREPILYHKHRSFKITCKPWIKPMMTSSKFYQNDGHVTSKYHYSNRSATFLYTISLKFGMHCIHYVLKNLLKFFNTKCSIIFAKTITSEYRQINCLFVIWVRDYESIKKYFQ